MRVESLLFGALPPHKRTRFFAAHKVQVPDAQQASPFHLLIRERLVVRERSEKLEGEEVRLCRTQKFERKKDANREEVVERRLEGFPSSGSIRHGKGMQDKKEILDVSRRIVCADGVRRIEHVKNSDHSAEEDDAEAGIEPRICLSMVSMNSYGMVSYASSSQMSMQLSLVLPCYNEEINVRSVVRESFVWLRSAGIDGELIVVDDGSRDGTYQVLLELQRAEPSLRVLRHERNRGYGLAIRTGIDAATREYVAFMDSDGQFHTESFALLLPFLADAPLVAGYRQRRADAFIRICNAWVFGKLIRLLFGIRVRDVNCGMKVFRSDLWPLIRPVHGFGGVFSAELFVRLRQHGIMFRQVAVPHFPRRAGSQTGATPTVICRSFIDLLHLWYSLRRETVSLLPCPHKNHP